MASPDAPDTAGLAAQLHAIADQAEGLRLRVGALAEPFLGTDREDVVAAVVEAERQLLMASRALQRALRTVT